MKLNKLAVKTVIHVVCGQKEYRAAG